uniref:ATP-dependent RNA helicase n=1 Tax=Paramormyrops kingsleyae TaxID=1676925 RepID=A0A3B3RRA3_9TELE|nr:ATP-dependent RNA helicase DDX24 [Paramormyrops kingsleyae]
MKPKKRGIQVRGTWKAVPVDPSVFSEENMDGLVCFEELTNYRLVDSKAAIKENKKKKGREAKKRSARDREGGSEGTSDKELTTPAKKRKKKKAKLKEVAEGEENGEREEEGTQDPDDSKSEETVEAPGVDSLSDLTKPTKNKNRKKVRRTKEAGEQKAKEATEEETPAKVTPPPKKKPKNWTNVTLSHSLDRETDLSAWKDLLVPEPVLQALGCLGFSAPTPIQALTLPSAIRDKMDILGAAETGSGKTLAFAIPMIHTILEWRRRQEAMSQVPLGSDSSPVPMEEEMQTGEHDDGEAEQEPDEDEEETKLQGADDDEEEENTQAKYDDEDFDSQELGCVKVIEDVEFIDADGEMSTTKTQASQKQPLLGLVLTPTRELAVQVKHHVDAVAQFAGIKTAIVVGGMAPQKQNRLLKRRPEIVIATPGRLWELIKERHPHLQNLRQLRSLVIDEADRMVEKGHFAELENLLEMLNNSHFSPERQTFVFSATLTMKHQLPSRIFQKKSKNMVQRDKLETLMEKVGIKAKPKVIDLTRKEATVETLTETRIHCDKDEKDFYLYYFLLQYPGRTMVFANSIDCIKRLSSLLTILECTPLPLHANMHQKQRLKNLERFAEKDRCVLLTTDVAARGLDIPDVQHVIHYQVPRTSETYVHRSGRTARATKEGLSLLLIGPDDMINFKKIYRTLGKDEELPLFPVQTKCMAEIKERVNLARKIEKIEYHNSREKHHNSWFKQAAEALELELDDDVLLGGRKDTHEEQQQQKVVKSLKKHLKYLLQQPIFKNVMRTKYPTQMGKLALPDLPLAKYESALESLSSQGRKEREKQRNMKKKKKQQQQD